MTGTVGGESSFTASGGLTKRPAQRMHRTLRPRRPCGLYEMLSPTETWAWQKQQCELYRAATYTGPPRRLFSLPEEMPVNHRTREIIDRIEDAGYAVSVHHMREY